MIRFCSKSFRRGALCSANGELHRLARARTDPSLHSLENHPRPVIPAEAAKQWIKEGKQAVKMTRLSCHRFRSNEVRLWLSLIAYNLGNLWRRLALPGRIDNRSLTSLQQRLVKTGGRLVKHARYH